MDETDLRKNPTPDLPTTVIFEARSLFFDSVDTTPIVGEWTVEYQPDKVVMREGALKDLLPQFEDHSPEGAAQEVYEAIRDAVFDGEETPPLMVRFDYEKGEGLYKDTRDFPNAVTVGRFQ